MQKPISKPVNLSPADMLLDTRSNADRVGPANLRWVESWELIERARIERMSGFKHLLTDDFSNNADLHNQLLALAGEGHLRQPINLIHEATQANGTKKLFVATQNRIYALNNSTGNYKIVASLYGGEATANWSDKVWWATTNRELVVFTNGVDSPLYHVIDQPIEAASQSVAVIPDLERLKVTKVGFVITWNHLTFYCNLVQDGTRFSWRVMWSDYDKAISIFPKKDLSLAGFFDFELGEVILNAAPMGNVLLFYTNLGIWQCTVGGNSVAFQKRYSPERPNDGVLFYPRTLVSSGTEHYYLGTDGLYAFSYYRPGPERVDWIHKASAIIFDDIDATRCMVHCAGYEATKKQLFFFWAKAGEDVPQQGLVINSENQFASLVPFGATAVGNFGFRPQTTLRDFMIEHCICTPTQLPFEKEGAGLEMEGGYCTTEVAPTCASPPSSIYTNVGIDFFGGDDIEDVDQAEAADASLCSQLSGLTIQELCTEEDPGACKLIDNFIFADSADLCLKQTDKTVFYRERCTSFTGCGLYQRLGYRSPLRSGPLWFETPGDKFVTRVFVEAYPEFQTVPSQLEFRLGSAGQAHDPNRVGACPILYFDLAPRELKCLGPGAIEDFKARNVRPDKGIEWRAYMMGRYIYWALDVAQSKTDPVDTGGAVAISRVTLDIQLPP